LNNKTELKKSIAWTDGTAFTIGAVLGSGILVLPAIAAEMAGPASIISWILMGIFSLPMVMTISRMSSRYPNAGGIAAYAEQAFGQTWGRITGLLMLSAMPVGMPLTALVGAHYGGALFAWNSLQIHIAAGVLLLLAVGLNYRGVEFSGRTQVFVVSSILFILTFTVLSAIPQIQMPAFSPFLPFGWNSVGKAMTLLFFAFMGWEMIGHMAEEFKNPHRDIALSLGIAFILINIIYLSTAVVMVGTEAYKGDTPATAMISIVAIHWGPMAGDLIALLGLIVCYCPLHTFIAGFSRLVYAQARAGNLPEAFGVLHPRFQTPYKALQWFIPLFWLILLLSYLLSWDLKPLISIPSTTFLVVYMIGMAAAAKVLTTKTAKFSALLSVILTGVVFLFSGWFSLFPIVVITTLFLIYRKRSRK
jgi:amino acid efflux transporter